MSETRRRRGGKRERGEIEAQNASGKIVDERTSLICR